MNYQERKQYYLKTEASTHRQLGNGRAEVFHELSKLALHKGPLNADFLRNSIELIDARRDCADFALAGVFRFLYLYRDHELLDSALRQELERTALNFCYWYDQPGVAGMCFHTENHQILFHSCELLAGQYFKEQILPNSGKPAQWHIEHAIARTKEWLSQRLQFGFSEWLSNCYFEEDLLALLNLFDFSEDDSIRQEAKKLIDIILL